LIWPALPEKAINNAVTDYRTRLQVCVSVSGGHLIIHTTNTNCYI